MSCDFIETRNSTEANLREICESSQAVMKRDFFLGSKRKVCVNEWKNDENNKADNLW